MKTQQYPIAVTNIIATNMFVFVLECQNNKYFVGKTEDPDFTVTKYLSTKQPSKFTTENKPIKVAELIPNCDAFDVNKYTKKYMAKYGIKNVQGGSYLDYMDENTYLVLESELEFTKEKKCLVCGEDHDGTCDEINLDGVVLSYTDYQFIHRVLDKVHKMDNTILLNSYAKIGEQYVDVIEQRISNIQDIIDTMNGKPSKSGSCYGYNETYIKDNKQNISIYRKIIECHKEVATHIEKSDLGNINTHLQKMCKYYKSLSKGEGSSNYQHHAY